MSSLNVLRFESQIKRTLILQKASQKSTEFLITNETYSKCTEKTWRIQMRPLLMPDLMGKSQIQTPKYKCLHGQKSHRSQSCDEKIYGSYGSKWRRLISQGLFYVKQRRHKQIIYRFKIYVRAVQLVLAYFKYKKIRSQHQKNTKRISKPRVSIAKPRKQSGQSTLISLPQFYQTDALQMLHQLHNESRSEIHSPQSQFDRQKQKTLSQMNFDNFLKRPIQQFIKTRIFLHYQNTNQPNLVRELVKQSTVQNDLPVCSHFIENYRCHKHIKHRTETS